MLNAINIVKLRFYLLDSRWLTAGLLVLFAIFWTNFLPLKAPFSGQMIPDSRSYLEYSQHFAEHVRNDTVRTPGYPFFLFCAGKWSSMFHVSFLRVVFFLQTILFLCGIFLWSEVIRKAGHGIMAIGFVVLVGLNPSFFIYNVLVLTEPLFFFLLSLTLYHLIQYAECRNPWSLCISLLFSCLATLTRPGFYYLNLIYIFLLLILLLRKRKMLQLGLCLMIYGGSILLFQANFYRHHHRFKLSMIDDITRHRYLRNAVYCSLHGKDLTAELRKQDSLDERFFRKEEGLNHTLKESNYYKEQWNTTTKGHTLDVIKVFVTNVFGNIHTGNTLIPENISSSKSQALFNGTRVWNMLYIGLFILFSSYYFIQFLRKKMMPLNIWVLIGVVFYQIVTSGVSFWQGDRLLISCQPFILVIMFIFFSYLWKSKKKSIEREKNNEADLPKPLFHSNSIFSFLIFPSKTTAYLSGELL